MELDRRLRRAWLGEKQHWRTYLFREAIEADARRFQMEAAQPSTGDLRDPTKVR